jgi:hypothetical protein
VEEEISVPEGGEEEEAASVATARKPRQPARVPDGAAEEEATAADFGRGEGGARAVVERFIGIPDQ